MILVTGGLGMIGAHTARAWGVRRFAVASSLSCEFVCQEGQEGTRHFSLGCGRG